MPVTSLPTSAYLHIPFCRQRCFYCDFPVSVVGHRQQGDNSLSIQHYVEVLLQEININYQYCQGQILPPLETIFFGGGTPSLLSVMQVERILEVLFRLFGRGKNVEISMEIDPGTFDLTKLQGYCNLGVNRFSLGVQSFEDNLLKLCGRSHQLKDIEQSLNYLAQIGVKNYSIDLISGLPQQSLAQWQKTLATAVEIKPAHISCYDLIVEDKTPFARFYQPGKAPLPSEEMAADMYRMAQQILTAAGYEHYEVSNYALPGFECRHNQVYWQNKPYYGFGMGATSYVGEKRFSRPKKTWEYYDWVAGGCQVNNTEGIQDENEPLLETIMLGLRLQQGLNIEQLVEKFGKKVWAKIWTSLQRYYGCGWVEILDKKGTKQGGSSLPAAGWIRLSDPEGFLFSNTILANLFKDLN